MSVDIEAPAQSMPKSLDSLKITPESMHRIYFELSNEKSWYSLMAEARTWFGKNWRTQPRVKRKFQKYAVVTSVTIWFEVPDPKFGTWVAVKLAVRQVEGPNK
jgi:hypothetical protein